MKLIRWIIAIAVLAVWAALIGTALYVALYKPVEEVPSGAAIVALAGNAGKTGLVTGETEARIRRAVELYEAGAAPLLVVTGGTGGTDNPPVAEAMRDFAIASGVPEDAILVENASHSTLQNALFTADLPELDKTQPIIIVTHRYHLPRANASFRWAGFEAVTNAAADNVSGFAFSEPMLWEAVKWPLNALRAAAASAAMAGDVPRENFVKYLE
ncbi:MAG: YdcF family protein [Silicimonas sp.]